MSRFHAARVAARIRKELGEPVAQVAGNYGEFTVLVDGTEVLGAGPLGWAGVLPGASRVIERVRDSLAAAAGTAGSS